MASFRYGPTGVVEEVMQMARRKALLSGDDVDHEEATITAAGQA